MHMCMETQVGLLEVWVTLYRPFFPKSKEKAIHIHCNCPFSVFLESRQKYFNFLDPIMIAVEERHLEQPRFLVLHNIRKTTMFQELKRKINNYCAAVFYKHMSFPNSSLIQPLPFSFFLCKDFHFSLLEGASIS